MKLQADLREFIELLNSRGVEFLIVGGHAVAFHGYPRYTGDIDLLLRPDLENARRVLAVLRDIGFQEIDLTECELMDPCRVVQLGRPPNRIDLLTSISGVAFEKAWSSRVESHLDGIPVSFPSRLVLLQNKRAAGRAKDLADIDALKLPDETD